MKNQEHNDEEMTKSAVINLLKRFAEPKEVHVSDKDSMLKVIRCIFKKNGVSITNSGFLWVVVLYGFTWIQDQVELIKTIPEIQHDIVEIKPRAANSLTKDEFIKIVQYCYDNVIDFSDLTSLQVKIALETD